MSKLFSQKVTAPTVSAPAEMPDQNDPAVLAARRKALADAAARDGRQSTLMAMGMSAPSATPAAIGDSYSATTLGGR